MNLKFIAIEIEKFKSFVDGVQTVDLNELGTGLHFVRGQNKVEPRLGSNGSGKTTIFDALSWCLYGRTPDGLRNTDIRPWFGKKGQTIVTVTLQVDDTTYEIVRRAGPNALTINGKEAAQEQVTQLLGLEHHAFCHTILLGQSQPLFFDLQPRDKMELLSTVLDLDIWDSRSARANTATQDLQSAHSRIQGEMLSIEASLEQNAQTTKRVRDRSDEWDDEQRTRVDRLQKELKERRTRLKKTGDMLDKADLTVEEAAIAVKGLMPDIKRQADLVVDAQKGLARIETQIIAENERLDELTGVLSQFTKGGDCPTCGRSLKGTSLGKHKEAAEKAAASKRAELKKLEADAGRRQDRIDGLMRRLNRFQKLEKEASITLAKHQQEKDALGPIVAELKTEVRDLERQLAEREEEPNPYRTQLQELRRAKEQLQSRQRACDEKQQTLLREIEQTKFWVKGFKDIRLYVIDDVLQELQMTTNAILEEAGLVGWEVQYAVEKETQAGTIKRGLGVSILSPTNKEPVRWESWSGGEGQRLRVVGALALSEVLLNHASVQTSLDVLDEPTQHLSGEGVIDLCELLADRARDLGRQTFYVDHMATESARFASVITIVKDKQGSHIQ